MEMEDHYCYEISEEIDETILTKEGEDLNNCCDSDIFKSIFQKSQASLSFKTKETIENGERSIHLEISNSSLKNPGHPNEANKTDVNIRDSQPLFLSMDSIQEDIEESFVFYKRVDMPNLDPSMIKSEELYFHDERIMIRTMVPLQHEDLFREYLKKKIGIDEEEMSKVLKIVPEDFFQNCSKQIPNLACRCLFKENKYLNECVLHTKLKNYEEGKKEEKKDGNICIVLRSSPDIGNNFKKLSKAIGQDGVRVYEKLSKSDINCSLRQSLKNNMYFIMANDIPHDADDILIANVDTDNLKECDENLRASIPIKMFMRSSESIDILQNSEVNTMKVSQQGNSLLFCSSSYSSEGINISPVEENEGVRVDLELSPEKSSPSK